MCPRRAQVSPNPEAIPDLLAQLPSDPATQPDVAARACPSLASGSWHAPGAARGATLLVGVGAQKERPGELFLVSAERSNLLHTAGPVEYKCEMFE